MALTEKQKQRIDSEEKTLSEVQESLAQQLSWSHARLRTESERAQSLTQSIVAARRDTDKQMLASDEAVAHQLRDSKRDEIESIVKLQEKPYFAHIVLEENTAQGSSKQLEYKLGIAANPDCRIIDWRKAPIAKLYYEYKEGEEYAEEILGREREGCILERNKVDITEGELRSISCGLGNFTRDKTTKEWKSGLAEKRRARGELPNVLQLITQDQFQMITEDAQAAVLIQGIAGSGKTTVALYRLAWLLHEDNSDIQVEDVCVVVYSKTLKRYIQQALPALGIPEVRVATFLDWCTPTLKKLIPDFFDETRPRLYQGPRSPGTTRAKQSMAALMRTEEYAETFSRRMREALQKFVESTPLSQSGALAVKKLLETNAKPLALIQNLQSILRSLPKDAGSERLREWAENANEKILDIPAHLQRVFANPDKILYWDESKLLDRETLLRVRDSLAQCIDARVLHPSDFALIMRLAQCLGISLRRLDGAIGTYAHLVVDEAQDFGGLELASLIASVPEVSDLTIVGDTAQQVDKHSTFPGWERLRTHWALGDEMSQFHFLSVSHRSTAPIMHLADHVLAEKRTPSGRPGKAPLWFHCKQEQSMVREALSWLSRITERFPDMLVAVLCKDPQEAQYVHSLLQPTFEQNLHLGIHEDFAFEEGILVTTIREVKGLEFESVLVWNCSSGSYPKKDWARRWLYVAITRAEEYVCLVSHGTPSPLLPSIHSKLVRGYAESEDEEVENG